MFQQTRRPPTGPRRNLQTLKNRNAARRADTDKRRSQIDYETSIHEILGKYRDRIESEEPLTHKQYLQIFRNYPKPVQDSILRSVQWTPNMTWKQYLIAIALTIGIVLAVGALAGTASSVSGIPTAPVQYSFSSAQQPIYVPPVSSHVAIAPPSQPPAVSRPAPSIVPTPYITPTPSIVPTPSRAASQARHMTPAKIRNKSEETMRLVAPRPWYETFLTLPGIAGSPTGPNNKANGTKENGAAVPPEVIKALVKSKKNLCDAIIKYDKSKEILKQAENNRDDRCRLEQAANNKFSCGDISYHDILRLNQTVTTNRDAINNAHRYVQTQYESLYKVVVDEIVQESKIEDEDQKKIFRDEVSKVIAMNSTELRTRQQTRESSVPKMLTPKAGLEVHTRIKAIKAVINKNVKDRIAKLEEGAIKSKLESVELSQGKALLGLEYNGDLDDMTDAAKIADLTMEIDNINRDKEAHRVSHREHRQKRSSAEKEAFNTAAKLVTTAESKLVEAERNVTLANIRIAAANSNVVTAKNKLDEDNKLLEQYSKTVRKTMDAFYEKYNIYTQQDLETVASKLGEHHRNIPPIQDFEDNIAKYQQQVNESTTNVTKAEAALVVRTNEMKVAEDAVGVANANLEASKIDKDVAKSKADAAEARVDGPNDRDVKDLIYQNEGEARKFSSSLSEAEEKLKEEQDRQYEKAEAKAEAKAREWDHIIFPGAGAIVLAHMMLEIYLLRRREEEERRLRAIEEALQGAQADEDRRRRIQYEGEVQRIENLYRYIGDNMDELLRSRQQMEVLLREIRNIGNDIQRCNRIQELAAVLMRDVDEIIHDIFDDIRDLDLRVEIPTTEPYRNLHARIGIARDDTNLPPNSTLDDIHDIIERIHHNIMRIQCNSLPRLVHEDDRKYDRPIQQEMNGVASSSSSSSSSRPSSRPSSRSASRSTSSSSSNSSSNSASNSASSSSSNSASSSSSNSASNSVSNSASRLASRLASNLNQIETKLAALPNGENVTADKHVIYLFNLIKRKNTNENIRMRAQQLIDNHLHIDSRGDMIKEYTIHHRISAPPVAARGVYSNPNAAADAQQIEASRLGAIEQGEAERRVQRNANAARQRNANAARQQNVLLTPSAPSLPPQQEKQQANEAVAALQAQREAAQRNAAAAAREKRLVNEAAAAQMRREANEAAAQAQQEANEEARVHAQQEAAQRNANAARQRNALPASSAPPPSAQLENMVAARLEAEKAEEAAVALAEQYDKASIVQIRRMLNNKTFRVKLNKHFETFPKSKKEFDILPPRYKYYRMLFMWNEWTEENRNLTPLSEKEFNFMEYMAHMPYNITQLSFPAPSAPPLPAPSAPPLPVQSELSVNPNIFVYKPQSVQDPPPPYSGGKLLGNRKRKSGHRTRKRHPKKSRSTRKRHHRRK